MIGNLLFLLTLPLTSYLSNVSGNDELNSFKSAVSDSVINNYEWFETPTYKKSLIAENDYESFATFDLAKETMKNVLLNEELDYKISEEEHAHYFEDVYTKDYGFSSVFNGTNKYATNFIPSMNWTTLDPGLDKMQKINVAGINEYNFIEGSKYQVCILAEYGNRTSSIGKYIYVFVYKDITHDIINDKFTAQIEAFIDKQAENLITKRSLFDNETIKRPSPKFADPTYAPSFNPVYSKLNKILSETSDEIATSDENYYNHAYYNKNTGLHAFNFTSKAKPEHSVIEANELFSLTSKIEDGNRFYKHYICEEVDSEKKINDWKENIIAESEKFPLFNNILKNLIDGSLKEYTIDVKGDDFKDYQPGDIKIRFKTNDKSWTKVKVEHSDHPETIDEKILSSNFNWDLKDNAMITSSEPNFATYFLPLLNGKYTFHTINSLGQYNIFTINIINAPKEPGKIAFLSDKKQFDTWTFDSNDMGNAFINVDATIQDEGVDISKLDFKDVNGDIEITSSDLVEEGKVIAKRFHVKVKNTYKNSQMVSFVVFYDSWKIEAKCSYYLCSKVPLDDGTVKSIDFTSSGGKATYDPDKKILTATTDVSFKVPEQQEKPMEVDGRTVIYTSTFVATVSNDTKEYQSGETIRLGEGEYSIKLLKKTTLNDNSSESVEESNFSVKVKGTGVNGGGLPTWAIAIIIAVPVLIVAVVAILIVKIRKKQKLNS